MDKQENPAVVQAVMRHAKMDMTPLLLTFST
jgi:hypothetical protein